MTGSRRFNVGQMRGSSPAWDDLDDDQKTAITQSVIATVRNLTLSYEPMMKSVLESIQPVLPMIDIKLRQLMPPSFLESLAGLTAFLSRWVPNWYDGLDVEKAWEITGTGIPLAFVPRARIVDELVNAADHASRLAVLVEHKSEIIADCRETLIVDDDADPMPEAIAMLPPLLAEAIDVLEAGHFASACALGIAVVDSAHKRTMPKTSYRNLHQNAVQVELEEAVAGNDLRINLALRPLHSLLTEWYPNDPVLQMPSRHIVAHWAHREHMTETNAIIIVMVATSLLLGLAEREALTRYLTDD
jgi:hypothetical protein